MYKRQPLGVEGADGEVHPAEQLAGVLLAALVVAALARGQDVYKRQVETDAISQVEIQSDRIQFLRRDEMALPKSQRTVYYLSLIHISRADR